MKLHRLTLNAAALLAVTALAGAASPARAAETYQLDASHSAALFSVAHLGVSTTHGRFNDVSGSFVVDEKNPAKSKVDVTIKVASIDSNDAKRDQHLKSPDFFDAKQFPTMRFVSKKVEVVSEGKVKISGDLTIRGVTRPLTFTATEVGAGKDPWGGFRRGYDARFRIKRGDFGMTFMPGGVGEEVDVTLALEGIRK